MWKTNILPQKLVSILIYIFMSSFLLFSNQFGNLMHIFSQSKIFKFSPVLTKSAYVEYSNPTS
ncbi:MAG: hypothetical protein OXF85_01490 [Candidatus Saccharibacteria bacterium]|nr:hypothetical protein [Candidatus Saccharibacteria bacterium]